MAYKQTQENSYNSQSNKTKNKIKSTLRLRTRELRE